MIASVEFFFLFVIIVAAFILITALTGEAKTLTNIIIATDKSSAVATAVAHAVDRVLISGNGTVYSLAIPYGYNISYSPWAILAIDSLGRGGSSAVLTSQVNISSSANTSNLVVSNVNGQVLING